MVGQKMAFLDATLFLLGQSSQHVVQMPAQISLQHLAPTFRDKDNVVLAPPTSSGLSSHIRPSGFLLEVCLAAHLSEFLGWTPDPAEPRELPFD